MEHLHGRGPWAPDVPARPSRRPEPNPARAVDRPLPLRDRSLSDDGAHASAAARRRRGRPTRRSAADGGPVRENDRTLTGDRSFQIRGPRSSRRTRRFSAKSVDIFINSSPPCLITDTFLFQYNNSKLQRRWKVSRGNMHFEGSEKPTAVRSDRCTACRVGLKYLSDLRHVHGRGRGCETSQYLREKWKVLDKRSFIESRFPEVVRRAGAGGARGRARLCMRAGRGPAT
ncbi:hypothetical protein EVAR_67588_1 [Eumeta japonica]|uniref:Uncharacterized protein n=1 Tax=Eumeta variegata TaxID=151549 RepID=A0A4C2A2K5_EUMVA|nr:hypothetical protein EVAR_67588_1 [Eumeta japonica]